MYKTLPMSPTRMRRLWLTGLSLVFPHDFEADVRVARVPAELTGGMDIVVSENLVAELMKDAGFAGLPGPAKVTRLKAVATASDLVHRKFHCLSPDNLWVTDITEYPTP